MQLSTELLVKSILAEVLIICLLEKACIYCHQIIGFAMSGLSPFTVIADEDGRQNEMPIFMIAVGNRSRNLLNSVVSNELLIPIYQNKGAAR